MEKQRDFKILHGFHLKIMAMIFMTFDHIGYFLETLENPPKIEAIFRILGRFSFPLFIFLLVEGVVHTRNFAKYFSRICILALCFLVGQLFYYFAVDKNAALVSPAVDLVLTSLCVYLLKRNDKFSFLAILPFGLAVLSLIARNIELSQARPVEWLPFFFRADYTIFGPILGIGFFYSNHLARLFLNSKEETKTFIGTSYERTAINIISASMLILLTVLFTFIDQHARMKLYSIPWQAYALFAFIPILFYSGKRGYDAKWFKYGCYIYFPMHLIIIFLIFSLL